MIRNTLAILAICVASQAIAEEDLVEPPTSPVIVSNPPAEVQEAGRGTGSADSVGSGGLLAIGTLVTIGVIYAIVEAVRD